MFHLFDFITGDAGYDRMRPKMYLIADVLLVCVSIVDSNSFLNVKEKVKK